MFDLVLELKLEKCQTVEMTKVELIQMPVLLLELIMPHHMSSCINLADIACIAAVDGLLESKFNDKQNKEIW